MLFYLGLFLLVIAVSLDGFGVGVTYGLRKIRVSPVALVIIMLCSGIIVLLSMLVGNYITMFLSPIIEESTGGIILIAVGFFCLVTIFRTKIIDQNVTMEKNELNHASRLRKYRKVLVKPHLADMDHSGTISVSEAVLLGTALALDAFGAGIGAAMLGYSPLVTASFIGLMSGIFVYSGIQMGRFLAKNNSMKKVTFLPPLLLIALGIFNIL